MPTPPHDLHDSGVRPPGAPAETAEVPRSLRSTRRMLKVVALLAAGTVAIGIFTSREAVATGAIVLAAASALLILTRIERAHRSVVRMARDRAAGGDREPTDPAQSVAWRAGARAAVRISLAVGLAALAIGAVAAGEVGVSVAVAAIACGIAFFGGATWLAAVGEEEASARRELDASRAPRR